MAKKISLKQIKKGIVISVGAQVLSLCVSMVMNLLIPKCLDEYQYAYWEIYLLYISYAGMMQFGILDGFMLRYSEYDYDELNKPVVRSQFQLLLVIEAFFSLLVLSLVHFSFGISRWTFVFLAMGVLSRNLFTYTSYCFQMTNRIKEYSLLVVSQRLFYGLGIIAVLALHASSFLWLCMIDICADTIAILVGSVKNRDLYFGKAVSLKAALLELWKNLSSGFFLFSANLSAQFITGIGKMIVHWHWGELIFGKTSFAFSVSNLFLNFTTAISVVLFPSIKRMSPEELPGMYRSVRYSVVPVLFLALFCYFPGSEILRLWLPKYAESLIYLGMLLPIIVFSSISSLLTNNFLKAYREEKKILAVNVGAVAVGILLYVVMGYMFDSIQALLCSITFVIMIRSVVSESIVMRKIHQTFIPDFLAEAVMCFIFVFSATFEQRVYGALIYLSAFMLYLFLYRKKIRSSVKSMR